MNRPAGQREAAAEAVLAVGAVFLAGAGGSRFPPLEILAGAIGLCLFVALLPPLPTPTPRARSGRMAIWFATLAAVLLGAGAIDPTSRLLLPALAWSIAAIPIGRRDAARARLQSGAATLILIAAFFLAVDHSMLMRTAWNGLSIAVTTTVSMLTPFTGSNLRAAAAASGLDALAPFLAAIWVIGSGRRWRRPLVFLVTTWAIGLAAVGWWMRFDTPEWFHLAVGHRHGSTDPALAWFRSAMPVFPFLFAGARLAAGSARPPADAAASGSRWKGVAVAAAVIATVAGIGLAAPRHRSAVAGTGRTVFLLRHDRIDFDLPRTGRHPLTRTGMFGLLPDYLRAAGYAVEIGDTIPTGDALDRIDLLVVINPVPGTVPDDTAPIDRWVRLGGGLLVLADHTDIFGILDPVRRLTGRYGIELQFDSARPARPGWDWGLAAAVDPVVADVDRSNLAVGIGTGASLRVRPPAVALVRSPHAFSDHGDRGNDGRGGFLGDYRWTGREPIGDLVLVAAARPGRGRVVVAGDTSPWQNLMLPYSYPFVLQLAHHLAGGAAGAGAGLRPGAGMAGLLLLGSALALGRRCTPPALLFVVGLGLLLPEAARQTQHRLRPPLLLGFGRKPVAVIDSGHQNRFARDLWRADSVAGLAMNLAREGYLPVVTGDACRHRLPGETVRILVEPSTPLTRRETRMLIGAMQEGLHLVASIGPEGSVRCRPLLDSAGAAVRPTPLGPVPIRPNMNRADFSDSRREPQFAGAWALDLRPDAGFQVLTRAWGIPIVATRSVGRGALTVIADPDFLLDGTLESETDYWQGNIDLLGEILRRDWSDAGRERPR